MRLSLPARCGVLLGLCLLLAIGCFSPPPPVTVTGKVTRGGKPIELGKTEYFRVILSKEVPPGMNPTLRLVKAEPDGSFTIDKVPPGKYRVAIQQMDQITRQDVLEDAFSVQNTPFVVEVDGKKPLEIDLDHPAG